MALSILGHAVILTDTQSCGKCNHRDLESKESASCGDDWCFMGLHNEGPSLPQLCLPSLEDMSWGCILYFWKLCSFTQCQIVHTAHPMGSLHTGGFTELEVRFSLGCLREED